MNRIPVKYFGGYPEALKQFDGKTVLFQIERSEELIGLRGVFQILPDPSSDSVYFDIEHKGRSLEWLSPPNALGFCFHLSQTHVDSIVIPKPSTDPQLMADWLVRIPLFSHHRTPSNTNRPTEP
jgi:hypothetical protein